MYIEVKKLKTKYQLYLVHSKRVDGKSTKLINQYLCSIPKAHIEGADAEALGDIYNDIKDSILQNTRKIPQHIYVEFEEEFKKLHMLLADNLLKLANTQHDKEV
jgi:hypothetical protein